jgi:hypothetical protein
MLPIKFSTLMITSSSSRETKERREKMMMMKRLTSLRGSSRKPRRMPRRLRS